MIGIASVVMAHLIIGAYKAIKNQIEWEKKTQELVDCALAEMRKK